MRNVQAIVVFALLLMTGALTACTRVETAGTSQTASSANGTPTPPTEPAPTPIVKVVTATPTPDPAAVCAQTELAELDEVVIGALVPLSNPGNMRSGFAMQAALNIAADDINSGGGIGGKPVRLITYDTAGIPSRAEYYMDHLALQDCAQMVVGLYHNNVASVAADAAHRLGIPLILSEPMSDELTALQHPEVFRIAPVLSDVASLNARWLSEVGDVNNDGRLSAVNIFQNSAYGQAQLAQSEQEMAAHDIETKSLLVDLPTSDWSPEVARIVDLDWFPDAVFIHLHDEAALTLHQELLKAGIGPQKQTVIINSPIALNDVLFWQLTPDGTDAVVRQIGPWASTVTPLGQAFAERYQRVFDNWPERYAFAAYDAFRLAADAVERADSLNTDDLIHALEMTDTTLASGNYYFPYGLDNPPNGTTEPAYLWHQWPDAHTLFLRYTDANQPSSEMQVLWPVIYATDATDLQIEPETP